VPKPSLLVSVPTVVLGIALLAGSGQAQPGPPFKKEGPPNFGPKKSGPKIGDKAPDFELKFLDAKETFKLSDNFDKRPTVLIFHSFT
jgi:hypothetical protein